MDSIIFPGDICLSVKYDVFDDRQQSKGIGSCFPEDKEHEHLL